MIFGKEPFAGKALSSPPVVIVQYWNIVCKPASQWRIIIKNRVDVRRCKDAS